jgi:NADPH2:quinone reductase
MRAWQLHELGEPTTVLQLEDVPDPVAGEGRVVIDVKACGLKFPDLLQIRGGYQVKPKLPFTPGGEIAGTVRSVGPGVSNVAVGDRVLVMGSGGLAEQAIAPAAGCFPIPDEMSFVQAACLLTNYGTTVFALDDRAKLQPGETLLVTAAAGGVGSSAIQVGKAMGANVIGLAGGPEKVKTVFELGADAAFDYNEVDLVEAVRAATDGRGVDVCYEAVGGDIFDQVRRTMAWDGRLLVIGFTSGRIPNAPANHILLKNYSIVGVHWGASIDRDPSALRRGWDRICDLYTTGHIDPLVDSVRPLDEAVAALDDLDNRRTTGKVVIAP